jgi:hypothetical protein
VLARPPSRARQRRYRQRQAAGHIVVRIEVTQEETAKLWALGYLDDHQVEDRARIADALRRLIAGIILDR